MTYLNGTPNKPAAKAGNCIFFQFGLKDQPSILCSKDTTHFGAQAMHWGRWAENFPG